LKNISIINVKTKYFIYFDIENHLSKTFKKNILINNEDLKQILNLNFILLIPTYKFLNKDNKKEDLFLPNNNKQLLDLLTKKSKLNFINI
jgi:hypothetical protein